MTRFERAVPRLPVRDLQRAIAFWRDELGFAVEALWPEGTPVFAMLGRDGVSVQLMGPGAPGAPASPEAVAAQAAVSFDVCGVAELHARLAARMPIAWGPEVYWYGRREFAVVDPDGYMLIFGEPTDDPPTCEDG